MSIGFGVFLIVVGAILTFALNVTTTWIDLHLVGWILMAAGLIVVIIGIALMVRKRQTIVTNRNVDSAGRERIAETDRRDDPPIV
ncbi:DUF6458 family protein [Microbacterium sp. STN6]|uniref:DUF6458 family protein n=1 Tax=Microbacterium sp. STN6 TaxID=2995588 RepID=UPI002260E315|nr:DUF6458 family protein [Microbacterium sp. STN6]MCX7522044.1 DUF6458 family protein [Microbacterium sp. STN6]